MNRITALLSLVLGISYYLATAINAQDAAKGKKENIEGVWVGIAKEGGLGGSNDLQTTMEFKGVKMTANVKGRGEHKGIYKISPDKSPATIDLTFGGETIPAIYELKGDELKICHFILIPAGGGARPRAFEATDETVLISLKRQKS